MFNTKTAVFSVIVLLLFIVIGFLLALISKQDDQTMTDAFEAEIERAIYELDSDIAISPQAREEVERLILESKERQEANQTEQEFDASSDTSVSINTSPLLTLEGPELVEAKKHINNAGKGVLDMYELFPDMQTQLNTYLETQEGAKDMKPLVGYFKSQADQLSQSIENKDLQNTMTRLSEVYSDLGTNTEVMLDSYSDSSVETYAETTVRYLQALSEVRLFVQTNNIQFQLSEPGYYFISTL